MKNPNVEYEIVGVDQGEPSKDETKETPEPLVQSNVSYPEGAKVVNYKYAIKPNYLNRAERRKRKKEMGMSPSASPTDMVVEPYRRK